MSSSWNKNNPAIRRIFADIQELTVDPSDQYAARPCEDDMFSWHFAIRGPLGTDYEGGVYHGRIVLPPDYPYKPPSILFLTQNGRWEVNKKICLSISAYHPEQWQPAWGIRTILEALISFMTTPGDGAVGALDYTAEERRRLAQESLRYSHPMMPEIPEVREGSSSGQSNKYKEEIAKMHVVSLEPSSDKPKEVEKSNELRPAPAPTEEQLSDVVSRATENREGQISQGQGEEAVLRHRTPRPGPSSPSTEQASNHPGESAQNQVAVNNTRSQPRPRTDWLLYYAIFLIVLIFAILYRKALRQFREEI